MFFRALPRWLSAELPVCSNLQPDERYLVGRNGPAGQPRQGRGNTDRLYGVYEESAPMNFWFEMAINAVEVTLILSFLVQYFG